MLNDVLNYELMSCIPTSMADTIHKAWVSTNKVPTAKIMMTIKKTIVGEAVQSAQKAVVDKDTEVEVEITPETRRSAGQCSSGGAAWSNSSPSTWPGPGMPRSTGPSLRSSIGRWTK